MRFLKNKIRLAFEAKEKAEQNSIIPTIHRSGGSPLLKQPNSPDQDHHLMESSTTHSSPMRNHSERSSFEKEDSPKRRSPAKNIVINFGRAIVTFATSDLALPYLQKHLENKAFKLKDFCRFLSDAKGQIGGIKGFRDLLLVKPKDSPKIVGYKKIFQELGEIFTKYFSVNWIMHGKIKHKLIYLKFRYKILRRVRNPELFTFLVKAGDNHKLYPSVN